MNLKVSVAFFLGLVPISSMGYIYEFNVMRRWDGERNKHHYFIGFSDFHDKSHSANGTQLALIERLLSKIDKKKSTVVIEDLCSAGTAGKAACGNFFVNARGGILNKLAQLCQAAQLDLANIEYRYCRVTSLAPALNHTKENLEKFASVRQTKVSALLNEIAGMVTDLQGYQDGSVALHNQYIESVNTVLAALKELKLEEHAGSSVAEYLTAHSTESSRLELIKRLLTFDSSLLDMKILHEVFQLKDKDKALVFAGGAHITRVAEMLKKMGFESFKKVTVNFNREYDLQRCLGSNIIQGEFCMRPEPLPADAFELDKF